MMTENALSMTEPKAKLNELKEHMPDQQDIVYQFGQFLAERLNDELVPQGFVMGCQLALYDLQSGVDGFTNQPINSRLVGYPPQIYALLSMMVPQIAEAVFPPEFAAEVSKFIDEVDEKSKQD